MNITCACGTRYRIKRGATACPVCGRRNEGESFFHEIDWRLTARHGAIFVVFLATIAGVYAIFFTGEERAHSVESDVRPAGFLKGIASAEAGFLATDADKNKRRDYWVGDVSGLFRLAPKGASEQGIRLIDAAVALADGNRLTRDPEGVPFDTSSVSDLESQPHYGYHYQVLQAYCDANGNRRRYSETTARNDDHFGFIAYPQTWTEGKLVFVVDQSGVAYSVDPGRAGYVVGSPPQATLAALEKFDFGSFPYDPIAAGWKKID